jgi:predicted PurR-regulated permease PerM
MPVVTQTRLEGAAPSAWAVAAVLAALLFFAYVMRFVLLPVAFSAAVAFVLHPLVDRLNRWLRVPRIAAVLLVYAMVLAAVGLSAWWIMGSLGDRVLNAAAEAPTLLRDVLTRLFGPEIHMFGQTIGADGLARRLVAGVQDWLIQPAALLTAGSVVVVAPATIVLTLVLLFYFIHSGRRLAEGVLWLAPPPYRARLRALHRRIHPMLRHYVRGVFVVVLYTSAVAWLVLGPVFRLPLAVLLAGIVGVLELIPLVGPAASMALIGISSLLHGGGLWSFVGFMAFAVGLRLSIDEVVGPLVLGRAVTLHPAVVIVAFLIASTIFGVLGVFFAVPVAASIKIVLGALYQDEADS